LSPHFLRDTFGFFVLTGHFVIACPLRLSQAVDCLGTAAHVTCITQKQIHEETCLEANQASLDSLFQRKSIETTFSNQNVLKIEIMKLEHNQKYFFI